MNAKNSLDDIITAIATPIGTGGVSIVRISGTDCIPFADKFFKGADKLQNKESHTITYGHIIDDEKIVDEVLVSVMKAPRTYTCEDVVEINCHGGSVVTKRVLQVILKNGARLAEAGEFTKRAFLNGRIDLAQAEGVIDLIHGKTQLHNDIALNQIDGRLTKTIKGLRDSLLDIIAEIEMGIDYPDHEEDGANFSNMTESIQGLIDSMDKLMHNSNKGKIIRDGLETVIIGKPNVGKSSLLNWILDEERAIVTDIAGTTRDTVEEYVNMNGVPLKIVDTAGIRETTDVVEKIGVEKSKEYAKASNCIIMIIDGSKPLDDEDIAILEMIKDKTALILVNKIDLEQRVMDDELTKWCNAEFIVRISVRDNIGFDEMSLAIEKLFFDGEKLEAEHGLLGNIRHIDAMGHSLEALRRSLMAIEGGMAEDFVAMDLMEANMFLGEITGDSYDEEVVHRVFTKFCLGK